MCIYKIALIYAFSTKINYTYINTEIWLFESTEKALGTTTSKHNCIGICNDNIKNTENVKIYKHPILYEKRLLHFQLY